MCAQFFVIDDSKPEQASYPHGQGYYDQTYQNYQNYGNPQSYGAPGTQLLTWGTPNDQYGYHDYVQLTEEAQKNLAMVDNDDKPIGRFSMSSCDPYAFRAMAEILQDVCLTVKHRFCLEGISIAYQTKDMKASLGFIIPDSGIVDYNIEFDDPDTVFTENDSVTANVDLKTASQVYRSYGKKSVVTFEASIKRGKRITEIITRTSDNDYNPIPCTNPQNDDAEINMVNVLCTYYKDAKPTCRTSMWQFANIITKRKNMQCDQIKFILQNDAVIVQGRKCGKDNGGADRIPFKGGMIGEVSSVQTDRVIQCEDGAGFLIKEGSVTIDFSSCGSWMSKINRLSPDTSVVSIYMSHEPNVPLIIVTSIGSGMGSSIFCFSDNQRK